MRPGLWAGALRRGPGRSEMLLILPPHPFTLCSSEEQGLKSTPHAARIRPAPPVCKVTEEGRSKEAGDQPGFSGAWSLELNNLQILMHPSAPVHLGAGLLHVGDCDSQRQNFSSCHPEPPLIFPRD